MGDIWNDSDDEFERKIAQKDWDQLQEKMGTIGYKNGIIEGKEATMQQGFNAGYERGAEIALKIGRMQGIVSSLIASSTGNVDHLKEFLEELENCTFVKIFNSNQDQLELDKLKQKFDSLTSI